MVFLLRVGRTTTLVTRLRRTSDKCDTRVSPRETRGTSAKLYARRESGSGEFSDFHVRALSSGKSISPRVISSLYHAALFSLRSELQKFIKFSNKVIITRNNRSSFVTFSTLGSFKGIRTPCWKFVHSVLFPLEA